MIVRRKYPKVPSTLHIELTEEEARSIMREAGVLDTVVLDAGHQPATIAYTLCCLLSAIRREADLPPRC